MSHRDNRVDVPLAWVGIDELDIQFANQFVIQFQPNEFVLSVGQATPPAFIGTPEQIADQVAGLEFVHVRPLGRFGMTRGRLVELIAALQVNLENHDRALDRIDPTTPPSP